MVLVARVVGAILVVGGIVLERRKGVAEECGKGGEWRSARCRSHDDGVRRRKSS